MELYDKIHENEELKTYILAGNRVLGELGFTEHGLAHAGTVSKMSREILEILTYSDHACALAAVAGYMHDIGNMKNLADKSDVRRSRVRNSKTGSTDIHDRVNYAVVDSELEVEGEDRVIILRLKIDTDICPVMEYFEIFLERMVLCKKSAARLDCSFELIINDTRLL